MRGKFITLEGIDGAGKSTHLAWLMQFLESRSVKVVMTREPGGTETGEALRALLLDRRQRLHGDTEALLMFAARREHLDKVILPALERGEWVLCDRFTDATYAYQSGGSGLPWERIAALESWVQQGLQPDLTLFFDVTPALGRARSERIREPDRFEQEQTEFFDRVRAGYLRRLEEHPRRIVRIDASGDIEGIRNVMREIILTRCFG